MDVEPTEPTDPVTDAVEANSAAVEDGQFRTKRASCSVRENSIVVTKISYDMTFIGIHTHADVYIYMFYTCLTHAQAHIYVYVYVYVYTERDAHV